MPRYEYKDAKSSKFWTIERTADGYDVCYGKIGTSGRQQSKSFDTTEKADKEHAKVVAAKIKKGYVLVGEGSADAQEKDADVADVPDDDAADGRPKGVPAGAVMADNGYEWELAERNAKGKYHGVVTWWRLDGTRCCRTEYEDGDPKSFQRFHPNGQVSREGTFKNGRVSGVERFHRSSEKTGEHFAVYSAGRRVWTAEVDHAKGVRRFFDKKGEPCDQQGKKLPAAVQPDERADVPAHWKAAPKSGVKQDWTPTAFETELRDGVYFTNDLRQVIFPRQGGAETSVRPVPDVDTAWAALRNAMWACDAAILEHQQSENRTARSLIWRCMASNEAADRAWAERLVNSVHQEVPLEQDIEFAKRFYQRYRGVCIHGAYSVATYARIADYLIATRGLGEAAVCLMKGIESELPYQRMASFERVRDMLAVATPSDYAAAKLRIMEGFVEAVSAANQKSYVGRLPAHLAWARSFLLPLTRDSGADERESADLALKACVGRGFGNDELNAGGLASVDIAGLERFLETNPKVRHEFFTGGARIYLASILDSEGVAAASILANMKPAKPFEDSARENNRWAFLLAHLDSDEALGALHDEHKAGYAWGAEGLSLAMQFQPARVESLLKGRADTDLLAALPDTKPLGPPSLEQRDADEDGNPGVYEPATPKRAPERKALIEIPFTCEWTPEEEEEALSHNQPLTWNGEPLSPETMGEWVEHCERWSIPSAIASFALRTREYDTRLAALGYAFSEYEVRWGGGIAMLMAGEGARGLLAAMVEESLEGSLRWAQPFGDHRIAPPILVGFIGKKYKADCRAWILRHPRCAWAAAITMALA
ncbi:MAG: WGR domain-containing protein, partial [Polyangiales bacterium]